MDDKDKRAASDDAPESGSAGAARLRDEIDRGGTGDKVAFSDPAAAPLGTDDEAGGFPPTAEQVRHARRQETRRAEAADEKPGVSDRQGRMSGRTGIILTIAALLGAGVLILLFAI